jgi:hypothetical protein
MRIFQPPISASSAIKISRPWVARPIAEFIFAAVCGTLLQGCGQPESEMHPGMNSGEHQASLGGVQDISVRLVAVVQRAGHGLSWIHESDMLRLTQEEKTIIERAGVTGQMEVVNTTERGSGHLTVRVVIIQHGPLTAKSQLTVPNRGSSIFVEEGIGFKPVSTNSVASGLVVELQQEGSETSFYLNYPRDRTRSGGGLFWWDANGEYKGL